VKHRPLWLMVAVPSVIIGFMMCWLLLYEVPKRQRDAIDSHALTELQTISNILALSVQHALERSDLGLLEDLQRRIWTDQQAGFAAVFLEEDGSSELLAVFPVGLDPALVTMNSTERTGLSARAEFTTAEGRGHVVAGVIEDTVNTRNAERMNPLYVALGLLLFAGLLMLQVLRSRVVKPLEAAADYARRLASGEFPQAIQRQATNDEVGILQDALTGLSESLQLKAHENRALVAELQAKLSELEAATETAQKSLQVRERFVANVSHEIRTPLNAILGLSSLLLSETMPREHAQKVRKIMHSGQHLLGIVDDILDFSKVNAGKLTLHKTPINTSHLLDNVVSIVQPMASEKQLELIIDVNPAVPRSFIGDHQRITQIILNFMSNAIKFTRSGYVLLQLAVEQAEHNGKELCFRVVDTGPGMTEEEMESLFREFEQLDNTATREAGGTGLGLVICKKFAELMGGRVGMTSTPGSGSCFWVNLPLKEVFDHGTGESGDLPQSARLLIVDDNPLTSKAIAHQLGATFPRFTTVASGLEAIQAIANAESQADPYEIVVIDWMMPGLDGLKTAHFIQAGATTVKPKIICVSAAHDEVLAAQKASGLEVFDLVLRKPVMAQPLVESILRLIGEEAPRRAANHEQEDSFPAQMFTQQFPGARALLVEDHQINQEVATELLQKFGLQVDLARNGQEALDMLFSRPADYYALVFMDVHMPIKDGLTASRELRAAGRHASLPVIAMTANASYTDRQGCLDAGMNDHVAKPIDISVLQRTIKRWLGTATTLQASSPGAGRGAPSVQWNIPKIPKLDTELALARCGGDSALYRRVLVTFCEQWPDVSDELRGDPGEERLASLIMQVHTLKSTCGSIGAQHAALLADKASRLLAELKKNRSANADAAKLSLVSLHREVTQVVKHINAALQGDATPVAESGRE
jgi:two-component system, sensor histidine kinase and response regulator